jgi:hypothetical protein
MSRSDLRNTKNKKQPSVAARVKRSGYFIITSQLAVRFYYSYLFIFSSFIFSTKRIPADRANQGENNPLHTDGIEEEF